MGICRLRDPASHLPLARLLVLVEEGKIISESDREIKLDQLTNGVTKTLLRLEEERGRLDRAEAW